MTRARLPLAFAAAAAATVVACAVNPATGKRQIMLVSEGQEVSMGLAGAQDIKNSMPELADAKLQTYVKDLGLRMAKLSERPTLPWDFTVLDDPMINAFALPGGPIFVTRGILTHFNSEAELASVLGHEIGHVTARHSAAQMSRTQVAQIGLLAGSIASDRVAQLAGGLSQGLGLLFLKYGRDDETQADALGFRYMYRDGYDVREMEQVFIMLERTAGVSGGRVPEWQSTHPFPENRAAQTRARVDSLGADLSRTKVLRDEYLRRLDGMVYGADPRQGFFRSSVFYHPELAFQLDFPDGWRTENGADAVKAASADGSAMLILGFAQGTPDEAMRAFGRQQGVQQLVNRSISAPAGPTRSAVFRLVEGQQSLDGLVSFVSYGGKTYRILGITRAGGLQTHENTFRYAVQSFARVTDRAILDVQPRRLAIVAAPRAMSVEQFDREFPSSGGIEPFLLVNNLQAGALLKRGQLVKRIRG
jgi:predicted Zn-dependent protease